MPRLMTRDDMVGIFPPVVTPFHDNEEVNLDALRREVDYYLTLETTGICVGGSTGEGHALTAAEIGQITKAANEQIGGAVPLLAGIITMSTRDAVEKGKRAADAGAMGLMATPPAYQIASDDGLYDFYATLHQETGLPTMVYNVNVNVPVKPQLMRRMAANQSETGLFATKESIGGSLEWLTELLETVGDQISVTWATDWTLYPGLALGARGSISAAGAILPRQCLAMWNAIQDGDFETAQRMNVLVLGVSNAISRFNWPAGVKAAINYRRAVGKARAPFHTIPAEQAKRICEAVDLADAGLEAL